MFIFYRFFLIVMIILIPAIYLFYFIFLFRQSSTVFIYLFETFLLLFGQF